MLYLKMRYGLTTAIVHFIFFKQAANNTFLTYAICSRRLELKSSILLFEGDLNWQLTEAVKHIME